MTSEVFRAATRETNEKRLPKNLWQSSFDQLRPTRLGQRRISSYFDRPASNGSDGTIGPVVPVMFSHVYRVMHSMLPISSTPTLKAYVPLEAVVCLLVFCSDDRRNSVN